VACTRPRASASTSLTGRTTMSVRASAVMARLYAGRRRGWNRGGSAIGCAMRRRAGVVD